MKTIIFTFICLIILGLVLKSCLKSNENEYKNEKRPKLNFDDSKKVKNDKIILIKNVDFEKVKLASQQFCNQYNQQKYLAVLNLIKIDNHKTVITFPFDIDFVNFCFLVNYLKYPNDISYNAEISGWTTTKSSDEWMTEKSVNKLVMVFIPNDDQEFDNVYMTTNDNIGYKLGFAMGEEKQLLPQPKETFKTKEFSVEDVGNLKGELIK